MSPRSRSHGFRPAILSSLLILSSASLVVRAAGPPSAGELYERAYFLEQGRGDLEGAIKLYRQIVAQYPEDRRTAARALLRLGLCYERLGIEGSTQAYRTILEKYGDQAEPARIAGERLKALEKILEGAAEELSTGVKVRQIVLRNGKPMLVYPGSLSPDGTKIAYFNWDSMTFFIQDLRSGEERSVTRAETSSATAASWSPDGKKIAFGLIFSGGHVAASVVDLERGIQSTWYRSPAAYAYPIHWTRDGRLVCSISEGGRQSLALLSGPGEKAVLYPVIGDGFRIAPDGKHVAYSFSKEEGGNPDLYVADLERLAEATPVAPHPASDADPIWSADGRYLAFRSNRVGSWDLWAIPMKESKPAGDPFLIQKDIGDAALDSWRSDGRLVYSKSAPLNDIWLLPMNPDTGRGTGKAFLLTLIQGRNWAPFWSPDGSRLGYISRRRDDRKMRLYLTRVDVYKDQEIDLPNGGFYNPTWSPDGNRILVTADVNDKRTFMQYDLASGEASTFLLGEELLQRGAAYGDFSPDGRQILFDGFGPRGELAGLCIYDWTSIRRIPETEGARPGRWSPDGRRIAFARNMPQGSIWLIRPDGAGLRKITHLAAGEVVVSLSWAPNGRFIAYTSVSKDNPVSLRVVGVDDNFQDKVQGLEGLNPQRVAWSPDGRYLALWTAQGTSELWIMENFLPKGK